MPVCVAVERDVACGLTNLSGSLRLASGDRSTVKLATSLSVSLFLSQTSLLLGVPRHVRYDLPGHRAQVWWRVLSRDSQTARIAVLPEALLRRPYYYSATVLPATLFVSMTGYLLISRRSPPVHGKR